MHVVADVVGILADIVVADVVVGADVVGILAVVRIVAGIHFDTDDY